MLCISVTLEVSKFVGSIIFNFLQDSNIFLILVTKVVSKVETFISFNSLQLLNIYSILVTFEVVKLSLSKYIEVNFSHDSNIFLIFVTF